MAEEYNYDIDYNEQMLNYYPEVIKSIREFRALIETQSLEVAEMHEKLTQILGSNYLGGANVSDIVDKPDIYLKRISDWERVLGIVPAVNDSDDVETQLSDRIETILARLYRVEKLNTKSIEDIVKIFTGGTATSYFKNGTITVLISPPEGNKQYKFENIERELRKKIPAHLKFEVSVNYFTWNEVQQANATWEEVSSNHADWNDVLYHP